MNSNRMKGISRMLLSGVLLLALVGCNTGNQEQSLHSSSDGSSMITDSDGYSVINDESEISIEEQKSSSIHIVGVRYAILTEDDSCHFEVKIKGIYGDVKLKEDKHIEDLYTYKIEETDNGCNLTLTGGKASGKCNVWLESETGAKSETIILEVNKQEESKTEQSKLEVSKAEVSKVEESKVEQSEIEESRTEQSKIEESNVEDFKYSEPIVFSGFGDKVITDIKVPNKMYKVELRHNGDSNFITQVYTKSGKRLSSLSNEIGTYIGEIVLTDDIDGGTLEVKADGEWYITFMDVEYGGTSKVSGKGDRVTKYFSLGTGVNVVNMRHNGDSNFIVCIYDNTGRSYSSLANEIGNYTGSVVFNEAEYGKKYCLEIIADGDWDIDFSKDDEVTYYN